MNMCADIPHYNMPLVVPDELGNVYEQDLSQLPLLTTDQVDKEFGTSMELMHSAEVHFLGEDGSLDSAPSPPLAASRAALRAASERRRPSTKLGNLREAQK